MVQNVAVDDGCAVGPAKLPHDSPEPLVPVPPQESRRIEVIGPNAGQRGVRVDGQVQLDLQSVAVDERQRRSLALHAVAHEFGAIPIAQAGEYVLDVLAGSQRVAGKIGARTEVVEQSGTAHRDPVLLSARGENDVVTERRGRSLQDALDRLLGPLLPRLYLLCN